MPDTDPNNDGSESPDRPSDDTRTDRPVVEANRYLQRAVEHPGDVREEKGRLVELLSLGNSTGRNELERRGAASGALAKLAHTDPASLEPFLTELGEALRRETDRDVSDEATETRVVPRTVKNRLVRTIASIIINTPGTTVERNVFINFAEAVTTDLDTRTLRVAAHVLFVSADERSGELASVAELLDELLAYPDAVIQALGAGTVGRVAAAHPDAVASTADTLRCLLEQDDETVQHNTVEALGALVRIRPDVVAPAAENLRDLLDHDEVAVQHNAAGVLGRLAEEYPDAVLPAVEDLQDLRDHDDEAVRRIATDALARLAQEQRDAVADR